MTDGVYRKTASDLTPDTDPKKQLETEPSRLTAVIQGGTIQVGYTPVAATLAAAIDESPKSVEQDDTARTDDETTPGFSLAPPVVEPIDDATREAPGPVEAVRAADTVSGVGVDTTQDSSPSSSPANDYPRTGSHPAIPIGFMVLVALLGQALFWGESMIANMRLVQLPLPLLIHAVLMIPCALWVGRAHDRWGPTPWLLAGAILATTLVTPLINAWLGGPGLGDVFLYQEYGEKLLNTGLIPINPAPEYPPLAVWTFGLIAVLINKVGLFPSLATATVMAIPAFVMWLLLGRSRYGWLVAYIGLLPWSAMWLVIRFDALPTTLLVVALLLVRPDKEEATWKVVLSALIFGLAAAAKWYPGIGAIVLFFGYIAVKKWGYALTMCFGSIVGFAAPHFPWILDPLGRQALLDAYLFHAGRGVTGESLLWQFLYPLGLAGLPSHAWSDSPNLNAGPWPMLLVAVAITLPVLIAAWKPHMAWTSATVAPALWLMANRIFSVQFVLTITVLWVVLLLLVPQIASVWRFALLGSLAVMNVANWMIWPVMDRAWPSFSAAVFILLLPITIGLWVISARQERALAKAGSHGLVAA
ncbi:hypothetical protein [Stomatohabitans albus]|uniref:hypothetical protein n=1 Tax=Stomatohabitans albus TaxID=3110766 RepID=UPI00300D5C7F